MDEKDLIQKLTARELRLFRAYRAAAGKSGECWPTVHMLAYECCMSHASVMTARRGLQAKGMIQVRREQLHPTGRANLVVTVIQQEGAR